MAEPFPFGKAAARKAAKKLKREKTAQRHATMLNFGKYKGEQISAVTDVEYIQWALQNLSKLNKDTRKGLTARLEELQQSASASLLEG